MGKKKKRLSSKKETSSSEKSMDRLKEMVLDHLGIPRPGASKHIQEIQDKLLPAFVETARHAWLAASPIRMPESPIYGYLHSATETHPEDIRQLNEILEDMGVHDLLRDVAASPSAPTLSNIPLDPYEKRLLRAAGHPRPNRAAKEFLNYAAKEPDLLSSSGAKLEEAALASASAHQNIWIFISPQTSPPPPSPNVPETTDAATPKPNRRKLFTGLGTLFSGIVLVAGNAVVIPTVTIASVAAIPVLGSLAAGIAAVGKGISELRGEGESSEGSKSDR